MMVARRDGVVVLDAWNPWANIASCHQRTTKPRMNAYTKSRPSGRTFDRPQWQGHSKTRKESSVWSVLDLWLVLATPALLSATSS
jgi:hypothetical protein